MNPGYPPYPQVPGSQNTAVPNYYPGSGQQPAPGSYSTPQPGFNPPTSAYPPQPSYTPSGAMYPPQTSPYPPQTSPYPPAPQSSPYPPQTSVYPGQSYYPSQNSSYPSQTRSYPSQVGSFSQQTPVTSNYPTSQPTYPVSPFAAQQSCATSQPFYPSQQSCPNPSYSAQNPGVGQYPTGGITKQVQVTKVNPTVRAASPFDPRQDAETLRKAMKGFGTDEKAIINVLARRSNSQRLDIAVHFKSLYGKDLISDLKSELGGNFENLIISMMTPLYEFLSQEIHNAISGIGTNEETLVEILCTADNAQIYEIKNAYQRIYYKSLEEELRGDTSGSFRRLLVSLCQGRRSENAGVNEGIASQDAQALYQAGELRLGTDESTFNAILVTRSYPQLQRTFMEYQRLSGRTFEQAIKSEFSGDIENGLRAIVKTVEDKPGFFAERLRNAMVGMGTKDNDLIRIIVSRSEIDLGDIKRSYQARYGKSLEAAVEGETSGDYKKGLLALICG